MGLYLCGLCNPLLYFCHLTVPLANYCPNNVAQNPLQPTGLKKNIYFLSCLCRLVGVWLVKQVWLGLDPGYGWVPGLLHTSHPLTSWLSRMCSFHSLGQGTSRRPCHASTFQASYLMSASIPLTEVMYALMTKSEFKISYV